MQRAFPDASGDHLRIRLLLQNTAPRYTSQGAWGLCNISRKEYIRASALTTLELSGCRQTGCSVEGPLVKGGNTVVDLGTLTLMMTSWSDDLGDVGTVGPWAGDRLAVTVLGQLEGEGWEDVSAMGLRVVKECVRANESAL